MASAQADGQPSPRTGAVRALAPLPNPPYAAGGMLRVLTLSTLFPNAEQPNFGVFVEGQILRLAARTDVELRVVNPIAVPPYPLDQIPRYRALRGLPQEEDWKGVRVARPRLRNLPGLSGPFNPALVERAAAPWLRRWRAEGFAFQVIDAQFFYPDGPAAMRLAGTFGVPYSVKARGADIHLWGKRAGSRRQILQAATDAGGMLAVSESLRQDMAALGMDARKIRIHYTAVDLDRFRPGDRTALKAVLGVAGPLIASVGALIPRKGHDVLIEAVARVPGIALHIAGEGPERARLAALAQARGVADRVRLLGNVPHARLPDLLAAADVMALASESEGLANAWVEAMACGTPVIIPDVDGAREAVDREEAGRLLPDRRPESFAAAIREVIAAPPDPAAVRASAERFTFERNTTQLFEHLKGIRDAPAAAG